MSRVKLLEVSLSQAVLFLTKSVVDDDQRVSFLNSPTDFCIKTQVPLPSDKVLDVDKKLCSLKFLLSPNVHCHKSLIFFNEQCKKEDFSVN